MSRGAWICLLLVLAVGVGRPALTAPAGRGEKGKAAGAKQTKKPYYAHTPSDIIPYRRMIRPYNEGFYETPQPWRGPGRDDPEPKVDAVKIGWLGPVEKPDPLAEFGQQMLNGSLLAVLDANKRGGYKGKPFQLMIHQDRARWGDSSNAMVKMACEEKVWGVLGTIDSANSHVMMRVALKFPMPILNAATTDQTLMEHRVPFITRVLPDDRQYSYATAWYLFKDKKYQRVALFRLNNRDGRFSVKKLTDAARRMGHPLILDQRFKDGETDWTAQIQRIKEVRPDAVVVWGNPPEVALILKQMRRMGVHQPVIGWFRSVSPILPRVAGRDAEGFVCAYPYNPIANDPALRDFRRRYKQRFHKEPDVFAAYAYDGIRLFVEAVNKAGLNRIRIADYLSKVKTYRGVTGRLVFDGARDNVSPIYLAELKGGKFRFRPATVPREGYRLQARQGAGKRVRSASTE